MTAEVPKSIRKRSDLVADQIKEAIISKKLPPGERLSDEKDFLKTYRVSKGTMREALKSLEVQGLVNIKTGRGEAAFDTSQRQRQPNIAHADNTNPGGQVIKLAP